MHVPCLSAEVQGIAVILHRVSRMQVALGRKWVVVLADAEMQRQVDGAGSERGQGGGAQIRLETSRGPWEIAGWFGSPCGGQLSVLSL